MTDQKKFEELMKSYGLDWRTFGSPYDVQLRFKEGERRVQYVFGIDGNFIRMEIW